MSDKIRADIALVQQKLCESRERAQAAIMEGRVFLGDRRINKPSESIGIQDTLILKTSQTEYVSRGALKLEKAVNVFSADLQDRVIMDIGSSTGALLMYAFIWEQEKCIPSTSDTDSWTGN